MFKLDTQFFLGSKEDIKAFPIVANIAVNAAMRVSANGTTAAVAADGTNMIGYSTSPQPWGSDVFFNNSYQPPGIPPGTNGTVAAGTAAWLSGVEHKPGNTYICDYATDAANDIDATGGAANTILVAANDAGLGGAWVYIISGTGAGQLRYVASSILNTSLTVVTAWTTIPAADSRFIVMRPLYSEDTRLITAGTQILGEAAQSAATGFRVMGHGIQMPGESLIEFLTPTGSGSIRERGTRFLARDFAAATATVVANPPRLYAFLRPVDPF